MGPSFRYRPGQMVPGTGLKIIRPLGSGGMGAVYEVEETSVEAPFVMKVVHPHLMLPGSKGAERMRQEAKTQARLHHKNIVRVYRAGVTDESPPLPYYVMDRLSGYTLRQALEWHAKKGALLPIGWVLWIGPSILQALEHAHTNGVVHRDVKPDNIFIHRTEGEKPIVKLLDFGIVAALSEVTQQGRLTAGGFAGTVTYAAPEQLQGANPAPTMDIYSAGIVLFEIVTGRRPFDDRATPEELYFAQLNQPPPQITRSGVHPKLSDLITRMLAKDPAQRPQAARDVLGLLSQIKTEWIQHNTDISAGDSFEFEFEVDLGERWPSKLGSDIGSVPGKSAPAKGNAAQFAALRDAPEFARVPPLDLADPGVRRQAAFPRRSTWGTTIDRYKSRVRASHVLLAAVGFAALTGLIAWLWIGGPLASDRRPASTSSATADAPHSAAASTVGAAPPAGAVPQGPVTVAFPAPLDARPMQGERPSLLPSAPKTQPPGIAVHGANKKQPPLPRPSSAVPPPTEEPPSVATPSTGASDDPMRP
jgi:serine/threonine protein kinase